MLVALLAVVGIAAAVRLPGLGSGLPEGRDPDSLFVEQALRFEGGQGGDQVSDLYPHFLARTLEGLPGKLRVRAPRKAPLEEHLAAAARPHLRARWLSALLSLLAVPAVYLLARAHLPVGWSLLSATFAGTSLLGVLLSHQARPHAALFGFVAWSLLASTRLARSATPANVALASISSGLALATLHSGAAVLPPLAMACLIALRRQGLGVLPRLTLTALGPLLALGLSYPFLFDGEILGGRPMGSHSVTGAGFLRAGRSLWAYEPTLVLLSLAALVPFSRPAGARQDRRLEWLVLVAFFLPYLGMIGIYKNTWHRFCLPLIPVLALLSGLGARRVAHLAARPLPGRRGPWLVAIGVALAAAPTLTAARFAWVWAQPTTPVLAARWIERHLDHREHRIVMSYGVCLPLFQSRESVARTPQMFHSPWQRYLERCELPRAGRGWELDTVLMQGHRRRDRDRVSSRDVQRLLRRTRATHVLVAVTGPGQRAAVDETPRAVRAAGGRLLARFVTYQSSGMLGTSGAGDQFGYEPISVSWRATGMGRMLELYELPTNEIGDR